ncbi:MAG: DMSO/TMAO reductase YedYZ molybdopterin-dependent catalytic subunit [Bacillariaceae sp.]|jgi:DMSO/TMAO reductase YedYZ molybdopterin-dependent catalytic subunit
MASAISTMMKGRAFLVPNKTLGQRTMILRRSTQHPFQEQIQLRRLVGPNLQHKIIMNRYFSSVATTANSADSDRYTDGKNILAAILLLGATASTAVINNNNNRSSSSSKHTTTCESAGATVDIDEKPEYTAEEVAKNNGKNEKPVWMTYAGTVYNVTSFVKNHPGGMERILLAAGGPVEPHWHLYRQHFSSDLPMTLLEPLAVGTLREIDQDAVDDMMEQKMENEKDPYEDEPERPGIPIGPEARSKTALKVHSDAPMNAEVPEHILTRSYLTPNHLYYMRHHHPVPLLSKEQIENYRLEIDLSEYGKGKSRISLKDLKSMPKEEVIMTMQCSGNRRSGFNVFEKTSGTTWGQGAISTAKWGGVRLKDILKNAGMGDPIEAQDKGEIEHVRFQSIDGMSVSIGIEKATNPYGDVMICYEMNDEELPRDHGFPLRVIVPGYAAVRSTKWLNKISISKEEAEGKFKKSPVFISNLNPRRIMIILIFFSSCFSLSRHSIQINYLLFLVTTLCNPRLLLHLRTISTWSKL